MHVMTGIPLNRQLVSGLVPSYGDNIYSRLFLLKELLHELYDTIGMSLKIKHVILCINVIHRYIIFVYMYTYEQTYVHTECNIYIHTYKCMYILYNIANTHVYTLWYAHTE